MVSDEGNDQASYSLADAPSSLQIQRFQSDLSVLARGCALADVERILGTDHRVRTRNTTQACDLSGCRDDFVLFTLEYKRVGLIIGLRQDPEQGALIERALVMTVSVDCNDPKACNFRGATSKGLRIGDDKDRAKELHGDIQARHPSGNLAYPEGRVISSAYQSNRIATLTLFLPDDIKRFQ